MYGIYMDIHLWLIDCGFLQSWMLWWDLIILEQHANQEEDMQRKAGEDHEDGCLAKLSQSLIRSQKLQQCCIEYWCMKAAPIWWFMTHDEHLVAQDEMFSNMSLLDEHVKVKSFILKFHVVFPCLGGMVNQNRVFSMATLSCSTFDHIWSYRFWPTTTKQFFKVIYLDVTRCASWCLEGSGLELGLSLLSRTIGSEAKELPPRFRETHIVVDRVEFFIVFFLGMVS